jgi:hypothetical protein
MLSSYPFALPLGATKVCGIILADIRGYIELGVSERAADLLIVLRLFLSKYPGAHLSAASRFTWVDVPNSQLGEPAESAAKQCPRICCKTVSSVRSNSVRDPVLKFARAINRYQACASEVQQDHMPVMMEGD